MKSSRSIAIRIQYNQSMFKEYRENFLKIFPQIPNQPNISQQKQKNQNNFIKTLSQIENNKLEKLPKQAFNYIVVPKNSLFDIIDVYEWRSKTQYPIVWAKWNSVVINKSQKVIRSSLDRKFKQIIQKDQSIENKILIQVSNQQVQPLINYGSLSFSSFSYALKEALIGFERLFALFGEFSIKPQMITVNKEGKVKVWLSNHYFLNTKNELNFISNNGNQGLQKMIVLQIKQIFLLFSQNNITYREFFTFIQNIDTFIGFLRLIQEYVSCKKILVSQSIHKRNDRSQRRPFSPIIKIRQVPRVPNFISPPKHSKQKKQLKNDQISNQFFKQKQQVKEKVCLLDHYETKQSLPTKSELFQDFKYMNQDEVEDFANRRSHKVKPTHIKNCKHSGIQTQTSLEEQKKYFKNANKNENFDKKVNSLQENESSISFEKIFGKGPFFNLGSFGRKVRKSTYLKMDDQH